MPILINDFFSNFEHIELPGASNQLFKDISETLNDPNGFDRPVRNFTMRNNLLLHANALWKSENGQELTGQQMEQARTIIDRFLRGSFDQANS